MKKFAMVLASTLLLTACGKDEPEQTTEERTVAQLVARIGELEEENRQLKKQLGNEPVTNAEMVEEIEAEWAEEEAERAEAPVEEEAPTEESSGDYTQYVQKQEGTTQKGSYIAINDGKIELLQSGDAFTVTPQGQDTEALVIPVTFTNNSEEPRDPISSLLGYITIEQEDDVTVNTLHAGIVILPDEYKNPNSSTVKPGASIEYYLPIGLNNTEYDVVFKNTITREPVYTLKFQ